MYHQEAAYTVIMAPEHLRANDLKERPVSVLFDDELSGQVVALNLTIEEARKLGQQLLDLTA